MDIYQVRYENGGFYLTIDNIKVILNLVIILVVF